MISKIGVINDLHGPWEDPKAVQLVLDAFEDIHIDHLILNGDIVDFYNLSNHGPKNPDVQAILEDELIWGEEFLAELRKKFPDTKITYLFGNHEYRLDRFIMNNCPAFWNILRLEKMFNLEKLGIEYFPYNHKYVIGKSRLRAQHSPPSYSKMGAMVSLENKLDASYIYGCTHRWQHATRTGDTGEIYHAWFNGWLGSTTLSEQHAKVFSFAKGHENWQQCAAVVTLINDKEYHVQQIPFLNNRIVLEGNIYEL